MAADAGDFSTELEFKRANHLFLSLVRRLPDHSDNDYAVGDSEKARRIDVELSPVNPLARASTLFCDGSCEARAHAVCWIERVDRFSRFVAGDPRSLSRSDC